MGLSVNHSFRHIIAHAVSSGLVGSWVGYGCREGVSLPTQQVSSAHLRTVNQPLEVPFSLDRSLMAI